MYAFQSISVSVLLIVSGVLLLFSENANHGYIVQKELWKLAYRGFSI